MKHPRHLYETRENHAVLALFLAKSGMEQYQGLIVNNESFDLGITVSKHRLFMTYTELRKVNCE